MLKLTVPGVPDIYNGAEPDRETLKLLVIQRALALRARRPGAFAGAYTPVDGGPSVCAFARGSGEVLVVVPVRGSSQGTTLKLPGELAGAWRDVLSGALRELSRRTQVSELTSPHGLALLERV